jgi:hypothetical protein
MKNSVKMVKMGMGKLFPFFHKPSVKQISAWSAKNKSGGLVPKFGGFIPVSFPSFLTHILNIGGGGHSPISSQFEGNSDKTALWSKANGRKTTKLLISALNGRKSRQRQLGKYCRL